MVKHHKINEGVDIGKRHDVEGGTSLSETVGVLYRKFACSLGIPGISRHKAQPENQLSQEGHPHTSRGIADEHRLVGPTLDVFPIHGWGEAAADSRAGAGE
jgi:hypothetical protein